MEKARKEQVKIWHSKELHELLVRTAPSRPLLSIYATAGKHIIDVVSRREIDDSKLYI